MPTAPQTRAVRAYRSRLKQTGMARFEVIGLNSDRELIRDLAKTLAGGGERSAKLRKKVSADLGESKPATGGIVAALRRSPLVGVDLDLARAEVKPRRVDL